MHSGAEFRPRVLLGAGVVALSLTVGACAGSSPSPGPSSSSAAPAASGVSTATESSPTTIAGGAVDPNAPEVVEPGDIPDDQVFVPYQPAGGAFTVDVPEGWARTESNGTVTFTDKYNTVTIQSMPATSAPTVESVRAEGLSDVSADPTFSIGDVAPVTRSAGDGVRVTYEIGSAPNEVTGRSALLAVERYEFFHDGTTVVLTLSGAKGADNVDPWRIVSDSLAWS